VSLLSRLRGLLPRSRPAPTLTLPPATRVRQVLGTRGLAGGRATLDDTAGWYGANQFTLPPTDAEGEWRTLDLDSATLSRLSPAELMQLLADLSPDVARALWDFLRFTNPGYTAKALRPGTEEPDPVAQAALDAFIGQVGDWPGNGSFDTVLGRLFIGGFLRGAFCGELVLDRPGRQPLDIATPDPHSIRFRRRVDAERGQVWDLGQVQAGQFVALDRPTIRYIPIDPLPGSPYGRALATPALFSTLFLLGLLHDLRRVVQQQGYPRLDIVINFDALASQMPADSEQDPQKLQAWVAAITKEVQDAYAKLEPDDAYVHSNVITVNRPVGAIDAESLGSIDKIIGALERFLIRALKTMPLLMGVNETTSETHANRQWEIHVAGIKAMQHPVETMLERFLGLALQAQGIPAGVRFRFAELRAAELLRDQQVATAQTANAITQFNAGFISQDEAAQQAVGHQADVPEPRTVNLGLGGLFSGNADPGSQRGQGSGPGLRRVPSLGVGGLELVRERAAGPRAQMPASSWELAVVGGGGVPAAVRSPRAAGCACLHANKAAISTPAGDASLRSVKIIPEGADEPLPPVPEEVVISEADIRRAINAWDALLPDYAGLLEAMVVGRRDYDSGEYARPLAGQRAYGDASPWVWDTRLSRGRGGYRNTATGQTIGAPGMLQLRDGFIDAQKQALITGDLADRLAAGEINVQQWVLESRQIIKTTFIDQYAIGRGGRKNMGPRDWGVIGGQCKTQYTYLDGFAQAIAGGELSAAQIKVRAEMYVDASVQAYERGISERLGLPKMPAYPGDGSTECRTNDRCHWEYAETETAWECTWVLDASVENCPTCVERARDWAPYVIQKG
jgi:hypothetical protein